MSSLFSSSFALVPVEGLILGRVDDITQTDPFAKMLSYDFSSKEVGEANTKLIKNYIGLYRQGSTLQNQCSKSQRVRYSDNWKESSAKRAIASTLQYIGLDVTLKSIVKYAKKFDYTREKFLILSNNLVTNFCNPNISVYSMKKIRNNFQYYWDNNSNFILPNIDESPFFSKDIKRIVSSVDAQKNAFNYTIKNFRSFCSWNGDTDNYFLLSPYLNNPFIMSFIANQIQQKTIDIIPLTKELVLREAKDKTVRVACENLICRRRNDIEFKKFFPRMIGSTKLGEDLKFLYCEHFERARPKYSLLRSKQKEWINSQSFEEPKLEAMNFLSLITKIPDLMISSSSYKDISKGLKINIKNRWDLWSQSKISKFDSDLFYEEPLEIKLRSQAKSSAAELGRFSIIFDITLGELDKMVTDHDKVDLDFNLNFSNKYLGNLRRKLIDFHNLNKADKEAHEREKLEKNISYQLSKFAHRVNLPLSNKEFSRTIAHEIIEQINFYSGSKLKKLEYSELDIPVKLNIGVFALRYIHQKKIAKKHEKIHVSQ